MSHIEQVATVLTDLNAVKAACKRLGVEFVEGKKTYNWFGRSVGDYPLPKGMTVEELGKCEHVVRIPGVNYEVGLVKNKEGKGFKLAYDFYGSNRGGHDGSFLQQKFGDQMQHLVDAYSVEALKAKARAKGFLSSEKIVNGKIQLTVTGFN